MRVAKATEQDFDGFLSFMQAAESVLEREKYGLNNPEDNFEDWDDDDLDKILIEKYRKTVAEEDGIAEKDVDNRILMYLFLKNKFFGASNGWRRVYYAGTSLIDAACDPTEKHLAFHPGIELFHVAPEQ